MKRIVVLLVVLGVLILPGVSQATENLPVQLPIPSVADMEVDAANGHLFLSGGSGTGSIFVLDFEGNVVKEITDLQGPAGMYLDGSTLYVALVNGAEIQKIDVNTLQKDGTIEIVGGAEPRVIEKAGGLLWVVTKCSQSDSRFFSIDPDTEAVIKHDYLRFPNYCPWATSSPALPNNLFAFESGLSPSTIYKLRVQDGALVTEKEEWDAGNSSNMQDLSVSPDGTELYSASGSPYKLNVFQTSDITQKGSYVTRSYPTAVEASPTGEFVAGGCDCRYTPDVDIFREGSAVPSVVYSLPADRERMIPRGLAFSPDESKLFAVSKVDNESSVFLHIIDIPALEPSNLILEASPEVISSDNAATISGSLEFPHDDASVANKSIEIFAGPPGGPATKVDTLLTDDLGHFSFEVSPVDNTTYMAKWAGDQQHRRASVEQALTVNDHVTSLGLRVEKSILDRGERTFLSVHLDAFQDTKNQTLTFYADTVGRERDVIGVRTLNEKGNAFKRINPAANTTYFVEWSGDDRYLPATSTALEVKRRVEVRGDLRGADGNSGGFELFRPDEAINFNALAMPRTHRTVSIQMQRQAPIGWHWILDAEVNLGPTGEKMFVIDPPLLRHGVGYRVRVLFKGNEMYMGSASSWAKFKVDA